MAGRNYDARGYNALRGNNSPRGNTSVTNNNKCDISKFNLQRILFVLHFVGIIVCMVYMNKILKRIDKEESRLKSFLGAANVFEMKNINNICSIQNSLNLMDQNILYSKISLYLLWISAMLNVFFLIATPALDSCKNIKIILHAILLSAGIVCIGLSTKGFIDSRDVTIESGECKKIYDDFESVFLTMIIISVFQTMQSLIPTIQSAFSMWSDSK